MKRLFCILLFSVFVVLTLLTTHVNANSNTSEAKKEVIPHKLKSNNLKESNNSDCTDNIFVCMSTTLHSGSTFAYSDYIWAEHGQAIEFGGASTGDFQIGLWVESEDGSFTSHVDVLPSKGEDTLTFLAPFDGNYRVVIQNGARNNNGKGYAYIKDTWLK